MLFEDIIKLPWRETLAILEKDICHNGTWKDITNIIRETYSQEQIIQINVFIWRTLNSIDLESQEADDIRDHCDYWWYAMDDVEKFHNGIKLYVEEGKNVVD